jgi:hypothetical protein
MQSTKTTNRQIGRLLLAAVVLLLAEPALAFRCKGKLVMEGDPQFKVLKFCGEPVSVQQRTIYRSGIPRHRFVTGTTINEGAEVGVSSQELLIHDRSVVEVIVEEWTYNFGPHKLMRVVRFENGLVAEIDHLGYGYSD